MGHKDGRLALSAEVVHPLQALVLKGLVAHGQDFVHQQDVGIDFRGDGEAQPSQHAAGILFDWIINELFQFGEGPSALA